MLLHPSDYLPQSVNSGPFAEIGMVFDYEILSQNSAWSARRQGCDKALYLTLPC